MQVLWQALQQLSSRRRVAVVLRYDEDLDDAEIRGPRLPARDGPLVGPPRDPAAAGGAAMTPFETRLRETLRHYAAGTDVETPPLEELPAIPDSLSAGSAVSLDGAWSA